MLYQRNQFVPVVVKSRDYLIGFIAALRNLEGVISFDENILDSTRYSDWLPDGSRRRDLETDQIKEIMKDYQESLEVKENEKEDDQNEYFFQVSCTCGNFYGYRHLHLIPHENLKCDLCGKLLIDYCGKFDYELEYDGDMEKMTVEIERDENDNEE